MEVVPNAVFRARATPLHRRPSTWLAVAVIALFAALYAVRVTTASLAMVLLGVAAVCVVTGVLLFMRARRAALSEMVSMIDAHLAAREAQPRHSPEEEARQRAEILQHRERVLRM